MFPRSNGTFMFTFCTDRKDYSRQALDWLSMMSFDPRFKNKTMRTIVNGEKEIQTQSGTYRVDGFVDCGDKKWCLEYNGCRQGYKLYLGFFFQYFYSIFVNVTIKDFIIALNAHKFQLKTQRKVMKEK